MVDIPYLGSAEAGGDAVAGLQLRADAHAALHQTPPEAPHRAAAPPHRPLPLGARPHRRYVTSRHATRNTAISRLCDNRGQIEGWPVEQARQEAARAHQQQGTACFFPPISPLARTRSPLRFALSLFRSSLFVLSLFVRSSDLHPAQVQALPGVGFLRLLAASAGDRGRKAGGRVGQHRGLGPAAPRRRQRGRQTSRHRRHRRGTLLSARVHVCACRVCVVCVCVSCTCACCVSCVAHPRRRRGPRRCRCSAC